MTYFCFIYLKLGHETYKIRAKGKEVTLLHQDLHLYSVLQSQITVNGDS